MRSVTIAIFALTAILWSQLPPRAPLTFEVASIKPSDRSRPSPPYRIGPDSLSTSGALKHLIMQAYEVENYQVTGGPEWVQSEFYDIQARAGGTSTPRQIKSMLQALLAERFHLKLNRETKMMYGFALIVDKNGPKLPQPRTDVPQDSTGVVQLGGGEIWARGVTMANLARGLHYELALPVLDETRIEGHYDFKLRFEEENGELSEEPDSVAAATAPKNSIFSAVREIGLRLESRKLPIEVLVVASAERASQN